MLLGQYESKLTDKGRLALPKKFRENLGDKLIVARWYEGCIVVVGESRWEELLSKLTGKTEFVTQPVRDTDRFILGSAYEVELDDQGRFVVPKMLRDYAKINTQAVFIGLGDRIEIWEKENWEEREKYIRENAENMIEKIAKDERKAVSGD